jgi:hypothetical protein
VLEAEELPGGIAHLHTGLADVDGYHFTLKEIGQKKVSKICFGQIILCFFTTQKRSKNKNVMVGFE